MKKPTNLKKNSHKRAKKRKEIAKLKKTRELAQHSVIQGEIADPNESVAAVTSEKSQKVRVPLLFQMMIGMAGFTSGGFVIFLKLPFFVRLFW